MTVDQPLDLWRGVKVALFVTIIGPLIGGMLVAVLPLARGALFDGAVIKAVMDPSTAAIIAQFVGMFSFVFGGLPALITGFALGWQAARHRRVSIVYTMAATLAAVAVSTIYFRLTVFLGEQAANMPVYVAIVLPLSLISAVISRWLMIRIGFLPAVERLR